MKAKKLRDNDEEHWTDHTRLDEPKTHHGAVTTNLGAAIRSYRLLRSLTLRELSPGIGVSTATLLRIEQGYDMDHRTFLKVLNWFGQRVSKGAR